MVTQSLVPPSFYPKTKNSYNSLVTVVKPNIAIDALRVLAILAVILIHTSIKIIQLGGRGLFLHQIASFAVPVFFMLSGFVLELHAANFNLVKRLSKLVLPLFFWSLIYFYWVYPGGSNFWWAFITGSASYQLYFIPTLIIFYLLFPWLRRLTHPWLLIFLGLVQFYLLYHDFYVAQLSLVLPLRIAALGFFAFILGIMASRHQAQLLKLSHKYQLILLGLIIFLAWFIFREGQTGNYYSQWRPSVLVYSVCIAAFFYQLFTRLKLPKFTHTFSNLSFFVFFVHVIILEVISRSLTRTNNLVLFSLVTGISFGLAFLAHKIPHASKLTG